MRVLFDKIPPKTLARCRDLLLRWATDEADRDVHTITLHDGPSSMQEALATMNTDYQTIAFDHVGFRRTPYKGGWDGLDRIWLVEPLEELDEKLLQKIEERL